MKELEKIVTSAMTCFLTASTLCMAAHIPSAVAAEKMEKCYGIVKAGMNDCPTAKSSCAGSSTKDKQGDAFILLPKGACEKIVDGSLTVKKD